jgi:hypothetical protein
LQPSTAAPLLSGKSEALPTRGKKPVPVFRDLSDWASAYQHKIAESDDAAQSFCAEKGIPFRTSGKFVNPHSISHVCRDEALRQIYLTEGRGKHSLTVLDWFGGARNISFSPAFGPFGTVVVEEHQLASKTALKICYTTGPSTAICGDNGRSVGTDKQEVKGLKFDVVVLQDIYHHGSTPHSALRPEGVLEIIQYSLPGRIYICNRAFFGVAGADVFGEKTEQVFYRTSNDLVVSSPDATAAAYAEHPDTDWLASYRSLGGVDIAPLNKVGPYYVVRASASLPCAQPLGVQHLPEGNFQLVDLRERTLMKNCLYSFWTSTIGSALCWVAGVDNGHLPPVKVHIPTVIKFASKFAVKIPNGQIMDNLFSTVERSMLADKECQALFSRFPLQYSEIVKGTWMASLHSERRSVGRDMNQLRRRNADTEHNLIPTRSASAFPIQKMGWWSVGFGVSALGLLALAKRRNGAWIIPSRPKVSAILEEGLAFLCEPLAGIGIAYETLTNFRENPYVSMATLGMHGICWYLRSINVVTRLFGVGLHVCWNHRIGMRRVFGAGEKFFEAYCSGMIPEFNESGWEPLPEGTILPSYQTRIMDGPENFRGTINVQVDNVSVDLSQAFELLNEGQGINRTFPILITHRLLHQPANTEKNLLAAIVHRLHSDPFVENPNKEAARHAAWRRLATLFISHNLLWADPERIVEMEEVYAAMGKKGMRIRNAYQNVMSGGHLVDRKTVNLKWNETLSIGKVMNGVATMKPRAIQNLVPEIHAQMAPFARVLNFVMHASFDGRIQDFCGTSIRLVFASGSTGAQLNDVGEWLSDGIPTFVASGDDSVVSFGGLHPEFVFGEADQSAFDHTQDDGPCKIFQGMIQEHLGFPAEFTNMAYKACSSAYSARRGRLSVWGECGTQMPTGITTTTTYNSLATLAMWLWWLLRREEVSVDEAGAELGFKVKFSGAFSLHHVTFLKGWWIPSFGVDQIWEQIWMPLPSAVIKLGKTITDPLIITSYKNRGRRMQRSRKQAIRMCALALASSYKDVPLDYPVLGPFLYALLRCGLESKSALKSMEESRRPRTTGGAMNLRVCWDAFQHRYGVTPMDLFRVDKSLNLVYSLPAIVIDPVFDRLAEVDY